MSTNLNPFQLAAVALVVSLGLAACAFAGDASKDSIVVYRAKVAGSIQASERLEVFDFAIGSSSDAETKCLDRYDPKYIGDLGSSFKICSNEQFYCIASEGSLRTAIPRDIFVTRQSEWSYGDLSCRADGSRFFQKELSVVCFFGKHFSWAYFEEGRGVVSFIRSLEPRVIYDLVGDKGIFARDLQIGSPETSKVKK